MSERREMIPAAPAGELATQAQMERVEQGMAQMREMMLAMMQEIGQLNRALALMRVSRTQETALREAVRDRARALCRAEGLPTAAERKIAGAIRTTVREVTGARALGDVQARQYDQIMELIAGWRMAGALRRIRKECEGGDAG